MALASDSIFVSVGEEELSDFVQTKLLCTRVLQEWHNVNPDDLQVSKISGGISNILVKVTPTAQLSLKPVAVKIYGDKTELLIDRSHEMKLLLHLNKHGFGAKVLAEFKNGRIEEFLEATTLMPEQMSDPAFIPYIARSLARFHSTPHPDGVPDPRPTVFIVLEDWLRMAQDLTFDDAVKQAHFAEVDFQALRQEVARLKTVCEAIHSPVVLAHNDLLAGNILILHDSASGAPPALPPPPGIDLPLQLIDFEYSAYSYRGFDLGNHFNEYAGFEGDYTRYPNAEAQKEFFRSYRSADQKHQASGSNDEGVLDRMVVEANVFALLSHAYWGTWCFIQARYSPIAFDYLDYSRIRWGEYYKRREEFLGNAEEMLKIGA